MEIATRKNLNDILECFGKLTVMIDGVAIEMILVKGYSGGNFYIGKYPVTQKQWRAVMGDNPSYFKGEDNPVEQVSWYDCNLFISKLNRMYGRKFRLPKEKEWEFAARGGNMSRKYTFSGGNSLDSVGWYKNNSRQKTHPVGQLKPNELGIYDMSGNVWEWCEDLYQPSEPNRVFRGGSWLNEEYSCNVCIEYSRSCNTPDYKKHNLGFRLVMDV
jgi:formylglycine-generating enzyme required for sulfatase activity